MSFQYLRRRANVDMAGGKFITFEGGEGAGKSTQAKRLAAQLEAVGYDVVLTREPGGSVLGERLRTLLLDPDLAIQHALTEVLLFNAARAEHLESKIRPALQAGKWVICDRFADSTRAYQGVSGTVPAGAIDQLEMMVVAPTIPDLTVIVDLDTATGLARADARRLSGEGGDVDQHAMTRDHFERRPRAFHEALRQRFLDIATANPERIVVVDGDHDVETLSREIWDVVRVRLVEREKS